MTPIPRPFTLTLASAALVLGGAGAATAAPSPNANPQDQQSLEQLCLTSDATHHDQTFFDLKGEPAVFPIARETVKNPNFRTAAWTAAELQVTLMSIPVGGDVGLEIHPDTDQFFRVESGTGQFQVGDEARLDYVKDVSDGDVMFVPQGSWHNVVNTGDEPLKLYVLYAPAHHPTCTVHPTQADDPHAGDPTPNPAIGTATPVEPWSSDPGAAPFVFNVEKATDANTAFRTAAWTGTDMQLTLMDIPVGGDVGAEMHGDTDQFLRVETGEAEVYFGDSADSLRLAYTATAGDAILVPAGTWHNIVNDSTSASLELYSIYGPPEHPRGTVHQTKADDPHWQDDDQGQGGDIPVTAQIPGRDSGGTDGQEPGSLALSIAEGGVTLTNARHTALGYSLSGLLPQVTVTDSRAESAGWSVTGASSDLTSEGATLPARNLGWAPFLVAGDARPGPRVVPEAQGGPGLAAPAVLGTSEGGQGRDDLAADVRLVAPAETRGGTYTGAVTVSLFPQD